MLSPDEMQVVSWMSFWWLIALFLAHSQGLLPLRWLQFPHVGGLEIIDSADLSLHCGCSCALAGKERQKLCLPPYMVPPYCQFWTIALSVYL